MYHEQVGFISGMQGWFSIRKSINMSMTLVDVRVIITWLFPRCRKKLLKDASWLKKKIAQENRKWCIFLKAKIVFNGVILREFLIRLGKSQECPLSLLLLNTVLELLTSRI